MTVPTERPEGVAYGECWCGCGGKTSIVKKTNRNRSQIAGEPFRYLPGGHSRRKPWSTLSVDCGYTTPCSIWQNAKCGAGYGVTFRNGRMQLTHIMAWERANGPVPAGLHLDHLCRNPACVNAEHLEPVTVAENTRRGLSTKLTKEQVVAIRADGRLLRQIAADYGVCKSNVSSIKRGRSWVADMESAA